MAIGAYEQTVLDMTTAYAAVANRGVHVKPMAFEIRGPEGNVSESPRGWRQGPTGHGQRRRGCHERMLQRVVTGGTGAAARLDDRPVAGKTGTRAGRAISGSSDRSPSSRQPCGSATTTTPRPRATAAKPPGLGSNMNQVKGNTPFKTFRLNRCSRAPSRTAPPKPTQGRRRTQRRSDRHRHEVQQRRGAVRSHNSSTALRGSSRWASSGRILQAAAGAVITAA